MRQPALLFEVSAMRKPAGQQCVPCGGTHGSRCVGVVKHHRLLRERFELRRALRERDRFRLRSHSHAEIRTRVADPHVIRHHHYDIGFPVG